MSIDLRRESSYALLQLLEAAGTTVFFPRAFIHRIVLELARRLSQ